MRWSVSRRTSCGNGYNSKEKKPEFECYSEPRTIPARPESSQSQGQFQS